MIFGIDIKARLRSKTFWLTFIPALAVLSQELGLHIFPSNYKDILNTILGILGLMGIIIDHSCEGISDKVGE